MHLSTLPLALILAICPALAQTTGVVGINDLTINSLGSGTTSCASFCFPNGGVTLNMMVTSPPGSFAIALFNFCPCQVCSLPGPSNTCVPAIPATACGPSNQSLDLDLTAACGLSVIMVMPPSTAGTPFLSVPIPTLPGPPCATASLTVQAVVLDPCGLGLFALPGPLVMTQAITLLF